MPRRASLEPRPSRKPHVPWVVNVPPALSNRGIRERHYFSEKKAADQFCKQQKIRLENYGTASVHLSPGKAEEAQSAFDRLNGSGMTLTEAVELALKTRTAQESSVTFKEMFERFIESKGNRTKKYQVDLRCTLPRFAGLHDRLVCEISAAEIEQELKGTSPSVRNAFLRYVRAAFNYGIRNDWCADNPVRKLEMERITMRKEILSNDQVKALLKTVCNTDLELLPYTVLCIFAGIRPEEVCRLGWENIDMEEKHVEIPAGSSKTKKRRIVEMEPLLVDWLKYYAKRRGSTAGRVTPAERLRKRLRTVRKKAKIDPWPQDAPRRTFASNWLALKADQDRLNYLMGHTSPRMLYEHYHKAVTRKNAKAFWKIRPPR